MVEGPAVGKAENFLDWIAGGLGMNELKDFGSPVRFGQGPRIFDKFSFVWKLQGFRTNSVRHQASTDQLQSVEVKTSKKSESQKR